MNYLKLHDTIISRALHQDRSKECGVFESHHITPKCEGGNIDGPQVLLTPKEHRIIHWLRFKITSVVGNLYAYRLLSGKPLDRKVSASIGGKAHHRVWKARDPIGYSARQRAAGQLAGANSRDNNLGFFALSEECKKKARDRGRDTIVRNKLGMFSDQYREIHRLSLMKKVHTHEGVFASMSEAAEHFNVTPGTVTYRVRSNSPTWQEWFYEEQSNHE